MTPFNDPEMEALMKIKEPYKKANRKYKAEDTIINIGDIHFGEGNFHVFSGPCSVESKEQITEVANRVKAAGATVLRGGAFKPRTSPYAFQGMAADGIELMLEAKRETGLPIVSEIMNIALLDLSRMWISSRSAPATCRISIYSKLWAAAKSLFS